MPPFPQKHFAQLPPLHRSEACGRSSVQTTTSYKTGRLCWLYHSFPSERLKTTCHLPFFFLGLGSQPSKASDKMQEDITLKKKNLQHPQRPTAPDDSLHRQKPTNSPIPRQNKQVTILKLQKPPPRCRPHGMLPHHMLSLQPFLHIDMLV